MSAVSTAVQEQISQLASAGSADAVLPQFSAFTRVVAASPLLARALTEAGASDDSARSLVVDLTKGQLSNDTVALVVAIAHQSVPKKLADALAAAAASLAFAGAQAAGELQAVEDGLYAFYTAVQTNPELRELLTNPGVSDKAKEDFLIDLLGNKLNSRAVELVRIVLALDHGRDTDVATKALAEQAATLHSTVVAEVRTAVELDDARKAALVAALQASVGKSIEGRFTVDPSIVGSVVVRIGDEVFDGSVRHRLEQAKVALTIASAS